MVSTYLNRRLKFLSSKNKAELREKRSGPPFNLTIYKGQRTGLLSRDWVSFILYHPVSKGRLKKKSQNMELLVHFHS